MRQASSENKNALFKRKCVSCTVGESGGRKTFFFFPDYVLPCNEIILKYLCKRKNPKLIWERDTQSAVILITSPRRCIGNIMIFNKGSLHITMCSSIYGIMAIIWPTGVTVLY